MLFVELLSWWYSKGLVELAHRIGKTLGGIWQSFSIPLLLRTLFAPWKRITMDSGKSIQEHTRAWGNNAVSRLVGFTVRIFTILIGLMAMLVASVLGLALLVVWPFVPPAIIYFVVRIFV